MWYNGNAVNRNLTYYFVTSNGEDLLTIFEHALDKAKDINEAILIEDL